MSLLRRSRDGVGRAGDRVELATEPVAGSGSGSVEGSGSGSGSGLTSGAEFRPEGAADPALLAALNGLDASGGRAVANRTRRAVSQAASDIREHRELERRDLGIALLTLIGFLLLLTPAIWNSIDDLLGGEFLLDMPGIVAALVFTLFAAVAAVLFLLSGQGGDRGLRHSRR